MRLVVDVDICGPRKDPRSDAVNSTNEQVADARLDGARGLRRRWKAPHISLQHAQEDEARGKARYHRRPHAAPIRSTWRIAPATVIGLTLSDNF